MDIALATTAGLPAVSLVVSALHDVSQAFDVWYYHLPFAARLVGIVDAHTYAFSHDNQVRYEGFPLFGELLQGILWRVTGHLQATNLVAIGALFALPLYLWRRFRVPVHLAFLAFLAIPLVQIHATTSYVDLPANVVVTLLVLDVFRAYASGQPPTARELALSGIFAATAVNMKFQLVPIVVVAALALAALSLRDLRGYGRQTDSVRAGLKRRAVVLALAAPVVFATPIKNAALYGNPVWPIELRLFGHTLPHAEEAYGSSPRHLENAPRPLRFVRSVLEVDNRPVTSQRRWSIDQWTAPDEPGFRMGGFFGAYVVVNLLALAGFAWRRRTREAVTAAVTFAALSVIAAVVPQSHELRYYMFWMLGLVSFNLIFWARAARIVVGGVAAAALSAVAWSTSGTYLYPSGMTLDELLRQRVDPSIVEATAPGTRICVAEEPFDFLYAPIFHPGRDYVVQEAATDAECSREPTKRQ